eukprot:COSAG05_NODE_1535_length_4614_cov_342.629900_5_plen_69_part_00
MTRNRYRKIGFLRVPGSNVYNLNADSTDDRSIEEFQVFACLSAALTVTHLASNLPFFQPNTTQCGLES